MTQAAKDAAKFLKNTLRLPAATFPARPAPADIAQYLPRCTDDLYAWQRRERPASNLFLLHDGPPYANGDLHVGHALNKIVKDIICRSKLAEGKRVDYVPGWDCHGLPIELKALEKHGWKRGQGIDSSAIRNAARDFAVAAVKKQMEGFKSWAVMGDWKGHWKTLDKSFEMRQLKVFQAMAENGLIYRKNKPVWWSPSSGTALAEAELEYKDDHVSTAAFVRFPIDGPLSSSAPVSAVIWTTTPWTLPANQAIAINESMQYSMVESKAHGKLVVAQSRLLHLEESIGEKLTVVAEHISIPDLISSTYSGLEVFGSQAQNRPFIHANFVSSEGGTGLVHCAPGHGSDDYLALQPLIRSGNVEVRAPVDNTGCFDSTASPQNPDLLKGQSVFTDGNKSVLQLLEQAGLLLLQHKYKHKYPLDWRTKEPVITRATPQWFADISNIKGDTLKALDNVSFLPDIGEARLRSFIENRSEWCISRQRAWGVPIPAIYHKESGEAVLSPESVSHIIKTIDERGIDAWWTDATHDPAWVLSELDPSQYIRGKDTMDVWFDSGTSWTFLTDLDGKQDKPVADVYLEGSDQHRGWFQSSLLTNIAYQKATNSSSPAHAPFKHLITHGFTLDAQGRKMSKSEGNVIAPTQIIVGLDSTKAQPVKPSKKHRENHPLGPDALRLWAASSDWTKDVVISETVIKTVHTALDKYRVTIKLLLGMLSDFVPDKLVPYDRLTQLDRIALCQLSQVSGAVKASCSEFEFHKAITMLNRYVVADLSGFYFEAMKDIIYCDLPTSTRRLSAQTTLHHIFCALQAMLGPITPLLVEESWAHSPQAYKQDLDHPLKRIWGATPKEWEGNSTQNLIPLIDRVNSAVKAAQEKARTEKLMGQSLASDVHLYMMPGSDISRISLTTWKEILVVSEVTVLETEDAHGHNKDRDESSSIEISSSTQPWIRTSEVVGSNNEILGVAVVTSPTKEKCARCWKFEAEKVEAITDGADQQLPLCERCEDAVSTIKQSTEI